jgi:hypothetical protein
LNANYKAIRENSDQPIKVGAAQKQITPEQMYK